jgi:putative restriction endonuclease
VHWMFDRGLLSIADDLEILVASKKVPGDALRLIREDRRLIVPARAELHPLPDALLYHRKHIFKG